jgi:hypothetical protein
MRFVVSLSVANGTPSTTGSYRTDGPGRSRPPRPGRFAVSEAEHTSLVNNASLRQKRAANSTMIVNPPGVIDEPTTVNRFS